MMRNLSRLGRKLTPKTFGRFMKPARKRLKTAPSLKSRGDRPLQMTFEDQLNALVYFHLEEFSSGRALIQALDENDFARQQIAPEGGIQKSSFFEAMGERGIEQLHHLFNGLVADVARIVPKHHAHLGDLQAIDGSLVDAVLSMAWAQYRDGSKKAKVHLGFDIRRGVPSRVFLVLPGIQWVAGARLSPPRWNNTTIRKRCLFRYPRPAAHSSSIRELIPSVMAFVMRCVK